MASSRFNMTWLIACGLLVGLTFSGQSAPPMVAPQQLQALLPNESNLQGFTRLRPAGELGTQPLSPATYIEDKTVINSDATQWLYGWAPLPDHPGSFSQIMRSLYSENGSYQITITLNVCGSSEVATDEVTQFLNGCSTRFQKGSFNAQTISIGDESWVNPSGYSTLIFRAGNTVILIDGTRSQLASQVGYDPPFPTAAVEAVAYQILLRASQQPELTGVTPEQAQVAVNGHALPKGAMRVAGQTYVPVQAFAKAMGLTTGWNAKTGALTLTGPQQKPIALTAGSTAVTIGGIKAAALQTPVLKQAGEPVMTLADLRTLTGGRVTERIEKMVPGRA